VIAELHFSASESEHAADGSDERREPLNLGWRNLSHEGVHALAIAPEDEARPSLPPELAIKNAPASVGSAVAVPKIIE
jgi:hypothetical protein